MVTAEWLRNLICYDETTGIITRKVSTRYRAMIGDIAGALDRKGYRQLRVDGHMYKAHRLAWLYMTGELPRCQIDHINLNKDDNRFIKLREATPAQNAANRPMHVTNKSGFKGVYWDKRRDRWRVEIQVKGEQKYLGSFRILEDAHVACSAAAKKYFGAFARDA